MTTRTKHPAPPDGALVRLSVDGDAWAEGVPPVPEGVEITVTFTDAEAALVHADALTQLGYRVMGVQPHGLAKAAAADFLVPQDVLESRSTWWRALAGQADRAFSLAAGPVLSSLGSILRLHSAVAGEPGTAER
jgi:hypothetical protein